MLCDNLIIFFQIAEGFVFAVICHRCEIVYMSKSVIQVLGYLPVSIIFNISNLHVLFFFRYGYHYIVRQTYFTTGRLSED